MITKFGKRYLTNYLAGQALSSNKDLAFGIGSTAVNAKGNDTKLDFEFYRMPIETSSIDISQTGTDGDGDPIFSYNIVYKTTIPQDIAGVISEVGLYPSSRSSANNFDSKFITSFDNNFNWSDGSNTALSTSNTQDSLGNYTFLSKIGENMVSISATSGTTKEFKNSLTTFDTSGYSVNDSIAIAYKKADTNVSNITINLYSSDTDYYSVSFTPLSGTGDKIQSKTLDNLFNNFTGSPDPTNITKIGVAVTASGGSTTVYFDGIRVNDEDTFDPIYGLISRSVLATPLIKKVGRPVDIEYKISLEF